MSQVAEVNGIVRCAKCTWAVVCIGLPTGSTVLIAVMMWTVRVRFM